MILRNYNRILLSSVLLLVLIHTSKVRGQYDNCSIESAIFTPGKSSISYQYNTGFCREWILGSVSSQQRITILLIAVNIDCSSNDKLMLFNEDRTLLLYDYCGYNGQNPAASNRNVIVAEARYILARLQSQSSRLLSVTFDMFLFNGPIQHVAPTAPPTLPPPPSTSPPPPPQIPQTTKVVNNLPDFFRLTSRLCPSDPVELNENMGYIKSPLLSSFRELPTNNLFCSWVIRAPPNHRVYLMFEYVNLPNEGLADRNTNDCPVNFITISSVLKPLDRVKLCGYRRRVKFITTYNNVLLNLNLNVIKELSSGFSLSYKIIMSPMVQTTTEAIPVNQSVNVPPNYNCGIPFNKPIETNARIIGGRESAPHSWPWQVMITDGLIMCGAALINNEWLLTAAHCTENINNGPIKAYIGMHNRLKVETNRVTRFINQVVVHPNYLGRLTQWDFDIALLRLEEPVSYSMEIQPICLPPHGVNFAKIGTRGYVIGWGDTLGTGPAYKLRQASITVIRNQECGANSDNMLCAGEKDPILRDSCQGDSGGPFFMKVNTNYYLVGIVSWGYDCNGAGVYTKVSNFVKWINSIIAAA